MTDAWEDGCPVARPDEKVAATAVRRWQSAKQRGVDVGNVDLRVRDLALGLIASCERDPRLVGPLKRDYEYLARAIATRLDTL